MISITLLSLPPETLQRMASQHRATRSGGLRRERVAALVIAAVSFGLAVVAAAL